MRNPVAAPASVIIMTLLVGFACIVLFSYATASKTMYVLEQNRWAVVWQRAFLLFTDYFIALQCAGALLAFSLFLGLPIFHDRKTLFRSLSSVVVSLVIMAALFVVLREGLRPEIERRMGESRSLGLFSDSLYKAAQDRARSGDPVTALEYVRFALLSDGRNRDKLNLKTSLLAGLTDAQYDEYLARTTGEDPRREFDAEAALARARAALEKRDLPAALAWARAVLAVERGNAEAMRIAGIAGEQDADVNAARSERDAGVLYARKREAYAALSSGKSGAGSDLIRSYYLLADLRRRFPFDDNVAAYLREAEDLLPGVSFFTADAALALSFSDLADKDVVFWNPLPGGGRELVSIESMVAAGDRTYYRNVEVAGFGPAAGGSRLLYHYLAPFGKRIGSSINFTGLDKTEPANRTGPRALAGRPGWDADKGLPLGVDPGVLRDYSLSRSGVEGRSLSGLAGLLPPYRQAPTYAPYARLDDLVVREIVLRVLQPLLLFILSLACLNIGLTQRARYLSAAPKGVYVWALVIPLVMLPIMEVVLFLHRMGAVFLYEVLGRAIGIVVIAALHVFFLILALLRFGGRLGGSLRGRTP